MGLLDNAFADLASTLLGTFSDAPATFARKVDSYDPVAQTVLTTNTTDAVVTSPPEGYPAKLIDGTNIIAGDQRLIAPRQGFTNLIAPQVGDTIVRGSKTYIVVRVEEFGSGDEVAAYQLQVRTP